MQASESFRIEVLGRGQRLPDSQLVKRLARFSDAIGHIVAPLRLGKRLQFQTETEDRNLWLVVTVETSGQMGLYASENPDNDHIDNEHVFEIDSSRQLLQHAVSGLQQLAQLGRLTTAALDRFIQRHNCEREMIPGIELLNAGLREKKLLQLHTPDGSSLTIDCTDLPKFHTSEYLYQIDFKVDSVGTSKAHIFLSNESRSLLNSKKVKVHIFYPPDRSADTIRSALFTLMQLHQNVRWNVRCTRSLLGNFHSVYVSDLQEGNAEEDHAEAVFDETIPQDVPSQIPIFAMTTVDGSIPRIGTGGIVGSDRE